MNREIYWINATKAICMGLVYFYHTSVYIGYKDILYPLYMLFFTNVFFFISGYLMFNMQMSRESGGLRFSDGLGGGKKYLKKIIFKIALPTILFSTINYFLKTILRGNSIELFSLTKDTILGGSLWFTSALFIAQILLCMMFVSKSIRMSYYLVGSILFALIALLLSSLNISMFGDNNIPWFYKSGMIATLYLTLGGLFWKYENQFDGIFGNKRYVWLLLLYSVMVWVFHNDAIMSLNTCSINSLGFVLSLAGIFSVIYSAKQLNECKLLNWLGRNTLGLYFLSGGIPNVLSLIWTKFGFEVCLTSYLLVSIISVSIGIFLVNALNKYLPFVFDLQKLKN